MKIQKILKVKSKTFLILPFVIYPGRQSLLRLKEFKRVIKRTLNMICICKWMDGWMDVNKHIFVKFTHDDIKDKPNF